jgi:DNA-binding FadR family transcriptional regulator
MVAHLQEHARQHGLKPDSPFARDSLKLSLQNYIADRLNLPVSEREEVKDLFAKRMRIDHCRIRAEETSKVPTQDLLPVLKDLQSQLKEHRAMLEPILSSTFYVAPAANDKALSELIETLEKADEAKQKIKGLTAVQQVKRGDSALFLEMANVATRRLITHKLRGSMKEFDQTLRTARNWLDKEYPPQNA